MTIDRTRIPWDELSVEQKREFAGLCAAHVDLDGVEDAKQYYGNKEKLFADAKVNND